MTLPLWGQLQYSQDNSETIEQAIARMISEHEADPTAHLGEGESLSEHKHAETIDHPAQSIKADKEAYGLYNENQTFLLSDNWSVEEGVAILNNVRWISFSLFSQTSFNAVSNMPYGSLSPYPEKDLLYTFKLYMNGAQNSDGQSRLFWATDNDPANTRQVAFVKDGTDYKWIIINGGSIVHSYIMQTGGEFNKFITLFYNSFDEQIELYADSELVSTYETVDWHDFILPSLSIDASRSTNTSIAISVSKWKARYDLFI